MKKLILLSLTMFVFSKNIHGTKLTYSTNNFFESETNDGSISNSSTLTLRGKNLFREGELRNGAHYLVRGIPDGLTMNIRRIDPTTIIISFTGNALVHSAHNSIDLTIIWNYRAFKNKEIFPMEKLKILFI